ncbi:MAG: Nif3-like dinuclear metal center hexameric protein [Chitinophagaceae bacterium]|nr:Nif3-like dinuclear metal center hexameric protein [Chitinophagaceae bacterium]
MKVAEIIRLFDAYAPFRYQESYDKSGLQVGDPNDTVTGALLSLDITEAVLDEAIEKGCNLIIAHHPVIFSGIKNLTGRNYVQRVVQKAIKHDINLLAVHTNLDNMRQGVNQRIAERLGLQDTRILAPLSGNLLKLCTYVPTAQAEHLRTALFAAGAGHIGQYSECSFSSTGSGTFRGSKDSKPFIGTAGGAQEKVQEDKIEVLVPVHLKNRVEQALVAAHPYEEVAFDWLQLQNHNPETGAGMTGSLPLPVPATEFLALLKKQMKAGMVRHTALTDKAVQKIAVCGGSGSFLLKDAIAAGADVFVTADFKYHQFFDAEGKILIADIGHFESEQFTVEIFDDILKKKNVTFAVLLSTLDTNPIKYF